MKTLAVLQPSFLPWLGYFDQMKRADVFVLYDDVQFDKHGWRNRNRIKSLAGEPHWVTVPVLSRNQSKPAVKDIAIDNSQKWARKQLGTIRQFYCKAPHFDEHYGRLEEILSKPHTLLIDLNLEIIRWFCDLLEIKTEIILASELGIEGEQSERLLKLCQHFGASRYLSGNAAQDYLDCALFEKNNVEVVWQNYEHPIYTQINGPFVPYLSALDLFLNVGANGAELFKSNQQFSVAEGRNVPMETET